MRKNAVILILMAFLLAVPMPAFASDSAETSEPAVSVESSETSETAAPAELHPVTNLKAVSREFRCITISWQGDYATYTVCRKSGDKWVKIAETTETSYTDKGLKAGGSFSYRIETDTVSETVSAKVITMKNAGRTMIKSGSSRYDIRIAAKQRLYGYDTVQGSCSYGGYAYFALYNRKYERIKIAKVNLKTMKVAKVSKVIKKCHGDTLTYNPRTKRIIVCCGKGSRKRIAVVNASTLKLSYTKSFSFKVAGISYNRAHNVYVVKLRDTPTKAAVLNSSFKVVKYIKMEGYKSYLLNQGIYTEGDYIYDVQSFKGSHKYNLITIRTMSGTLVGRVKVYSGTSGQLFELESIFKEGNQWYFSFYRAKVRKKGDLHRKNYLYKASF